MKPFLVQPWIHEITYRPNAPNALPLPRNQPLLQQGLPGQIPNAYGKSRKYFRFS